jgi:hypothetical protein
VFGGHKSDFDGHSKQTFSSERESLLRGARGAATPLAHPPRTPLATAADLNIYASVYGDRCMQIGAQFLPQPGYAEVYANNTCVLVPGAECLDLGQRPSDVPAPGPAFYARVGFYNNTIYSEQGGSCRTGGVGPANMSEFQSRGYEAGPASTIITTLPSADTIIGWAKGKLSSSAARIAAAIARS